MKCRNPFTQVRKTTGGHQGFPRARKSPQRRTLNLTMLIAYGGSGQSGTGIVFQGAYKPVQGFGFEDTVGVQNQYPFAVRTTRTGVYGRRKSKIDGIKQELNP